MLPTYWINFVELNTLSKQFFRLNDKEDESGVGAALCIFTEEQSHDEATNFWPGIAVVPDGYVPVASCESGSGDLYFIKVSDGQNGRLYRVYHDAVSESGYRVEDAIVVVLSNYEQLLKYAEAFEYPAMTEQESLLAAIHEEVRLHPYDSLWPSAFAAERQRLTSLLPGVFLQIEHIGSTAVPGMPAKPIIDLLAGVESMSLAKSIAERVSASRYTTSAEFNETLVDRMWFMRWAEGHRTHHLHVVVQDGNVWREHLAFRDVLRSSPPLAARYAALKNQLAARHSTDREAYTNAKAGFIRSTLRDA